MDSDLSSFSDSGLNALYHKVNAQLKEQFLNRVPWSAQQENINCLSRISKELALRKSNMDIATGEPDSTVPRN